MSMFIIDNCRTYVYINIKAPDKSISSINTTDDVEGGWADTESTKKPKTHKPKIDMSLLDYLWSI